MKRSRRFFKLIPQHHHALFLGLAVCISAGMATPAAVQPPNPPSENKTLQIYFVDVEGGQATLFVTPTGQSLLIDTGWPGNNGRDADRIVAAAKQAGLRSIDYVLITHFHTDHVGGAEQLAARFPIKTFIDHGENRESTDQPTVEGWHAYQKLLASKKYQRITAKPGDVLPGEEIHTTVVSSDGTLIGDPLPGAGQENPACRNAENFPADQTENRRSLGTLITFGKLRILDLGDLTRDEEMKLVCPVNKLGKIDIYIVSHHGWYQSNSAPFVDAIAPRVAVMDNGAKKGARLLPGTSSRSRRDSRTCGRFTTPTKAGPHTTLLRNSLQTRTALMPDTT
jgi:beta-lactamase superfamily II metal-dependent hydrolase